ncbi:MAG: hypothetical protein EA384_10485 [Spirochaetaceae bacterium]|nr:MAG: hypothetical protein EA384_10485 [Spirochaetaceae bacterium]
MATMKALAAGLLPLLLGACQLFIDPAAPPFDDRLVLTRLVDDIFGDLRDETEMTVLDNGSRHFLLVRGRDRHGQQRTVAFDSRLRVRMNRLHLWDQDSAFADLNGDFVVGHSLFSGSDFRLLSDNVYGDPPPEPPEFPATGIQTAAGTVIVRVDSNVLQAGPLYAADWSVISTEIRNIPLNADPAGGFEWRSARHDPGRGRSGLVLWNSEIKRTFVIEISAQAAAEMQDGSFPGGAHVTDELPHLIISTNEHSPVFYTRRGVVVLHDRREHRVYHRATGRRIATYEYGNGGDFSFAYSPDGKWVYSMDHSRRRLYKARTWW